MEYPTNGITKAIVKELAPYASKPPSPKNRAWIRSATLIPMQAAHGPSTIAIIVPPIGCAVVPPGAGMLNIMIVKQNAAPSASRGTCRVPRSCRTRRAATVHTGAIARPAAAQVLGLRTESGMCILAPNTSVRAYKLCYCVTRTAKYQESAVN